MIIYDLEKRGNMSLYEYLYESIKNDILNGTLKKDQKLPSKRELAKFHDISVKTVVNAYEQLLIEGYINSEEKKGYFVADIGNMPNYSPKVEIYPKLYEETNWFADFTANNTLYDKFPLATWKKVMRQVMNEYDNELLFPAPFQGVLRLREAIAEYLYQFRGVSVSPECIIIGAGIEFLYEKLIKIMPDTTIYAVEDPGYKKIATIYNESGVSWQYADSDEEGISVQGIEKINANVVHVSPEHHFPLGTVMPASRRAELLDWANGEEERYIVEDDFDCEFRYSNRSIPALKSRDVNHKVIYMNTFSKTLTPAFRISYMVLPEKLMIRYIDTLNTYYNAVSNLEQYALAVFIEKGYFERHLSRMRKYYRMQRDIVIKSINSSSMAPYVSISGGESGTHLLLKIDTRLSDEQIKELAKNVGLNIAGLSEYCGNRRPDFEHVMIINYSDMGEDVIREAMERLAKQLEN